MKLCFTIDIEIPDEVTEEDDFEEYLDCLQDNFHETVDNWFKPYKYCNDDLDISHQVSVDRD